jgi:hypothetical protein
MMNVLGDQLKQQLQEMWMPWVTEEKFKTKKYSVFWDKVGILLVD